MHWLDEESSDTTVVKDERYEGRVEGAVMTQFALCVADPDMYPSGMALRTIATEESWLRMAAGDLFPSKATVEVPTLRDGRSIHQVFTEAHDALVNGRDFAETHLSAILPQFLKGCFSLVLWWGDDWSDLGTVDTEAAAYSQIAEQLRDSVGEVYLRLER
jgi:hypothetical protein